jgi:putative endonuclease
MALEKHPAVYIMANRYRGTLYVGVTSALYNRVCDHKNEAFEGFTKTCGIKTLVWYEHHLSMEEAIKREKFVKKWHRPWKFRLIEGMNPNWHDLHDVIDTVETLFDMRIEKQRQQDIFMRHGH